MGRATLIRLYRHALKPHSRCLRTSMTDSEQRLWSRLRRKQLLSVQCYRQKPLGDYIVDFYAPEVGLVIEIDGSQHLEEAAVEEDAQRDAYLQELGLQVLRFDSLQVLQELEAVVQVIYVAMSQRLAERASGAQIPPSPPLQKGGMEQTVGQKGEA